jgi:hypothetical protein
MRVWRTLTLPFCPVFHKIAVIVTCESKKDGAPLSKVRKTNHFLCSPPPTRAYSTKRRQEEKDAN